MANHPDRPDRDPADPHLEEGEEYAETMALDLSGSGLLDGEDPNEATMPMSAGEAQAFLARMEADKGKADPRRQTLDESPEVVDQAMRHLEDKPRVSSTGRPIAATVAERAVPVAEGFETGSLPAQGPGQPARNDSPHTAPNPVVDGPNTEQLQVADIPRTQAAPRVREPAPAAPAAAPADSSQALVYAIIAVGVLLVLAIIGIVVLVAT